MDTAQLLLTELVANVVTHVGAPMTVRMRRRPEGIRVEVDDPSAQLPETHAVDELSEHGRGLLLIAALATRWGTTTRPDEPGKTVWFELDAD